MDFFVAIFQIAAPEGLFLLVRISLKSQSIAANVEWHSSKSALLRRSDISEFCQVGIFFERNTGIYFESKSSAHIAVTFVSFC